MELVLFGLLAFPAYPVCQDPPDAPLEGTIHILQNPAVEGHEVRGEELEDELLVGVPGDEVGDELVFERVGVDGEGRVDVLLGVGGFVFGCGGERELGDFEEDGGDRVQ